MSFTARELITKAYYLSGVVARSAQSVTGEQLSDGLDLLNSLLTEKDVFLSLIPYYQEYSFDAVNGQEKYEIPNLVDVDVLTFNIGTVRYQTDKRSRIDYFGKPRVDSIESLPFSWHLERTKDGADLYLYFLPYDAYDMKLWGKFGFSDVAYDDDLLQNYDRFYINYLRYALAEYICAEYNIVFQPQSAKKLKELESILRNVSPKDLHINKYSSLTRRFGYNYGVINLSEGWTP